MRLILSFLISISIFSYLYNSEAEFVDPDLVQSESFSSKPGNGLGLVGNMAVSAAQKSIETFGYAFIAVFIKLFNWTKTGVINEGKNLSNWSIETASKLASVGSTASDAELILKYHSSLDNRSFFRDCLSKVAILSSQIANGIRSNPHIQIVKNKLIDISQKVKISERFNILLEQLNKLPLKKYGFTLLSLYLLKRLLFPTTKNNIKINVNVSTSGASAQTTDN